MDAYRLLGLKPGANSHDVKKAFRRLAMRWHPDRNADPQAVEHFKQLRAAYEALLEALAHPQQESAAEAPAGDARGTTPRGPDRHQELILTIEQSCCGGEIAVTVEDTETCRACDGRGEEKLRHSRLCDHCHGSGRLRSKRGLSSCPDCGGRGYRTTQACPVCGGSGRTGTHREVFVDLPAGLLDGDEFRVAAAGFPREDGMGVPGDLVLRVGLAEHALYRRDQRDLRLSRPVGMLRLLLGGELAVPLPGGVRHVALPAGVTSARTLRVAGAGIPGRNGQADGDVFIELEPVAPEALSDEMHTLLERIDTLIARDHSRHLPDVALWEQRWLDSATDEA